MPGGAEVLGGLIWISTRRLSPAGPVTAMGVLTFLASCAIGHWGDKLLMRLAFGADDWMRLLRELQAHDADLARYSRENAGLTTSQLVKGYLATHRLPAFHFSRPNIAPLGFKVSDWRDTVPRIVVSFGCYKNVVFNSATMTVEQSD